MRPHEFGHRISLLEEFVRVERGRPPVESRQPGVRYVPVHSLNPLYLSEPEVVRSFRDHLDGHHLVDVPPHLYGVRRRVVVGDGSQKGVYGSRALPDRVGEPVEPLWVRSFPQLEVGFGIRGPNQLLHPGYRDGFLPHVGPDRGSQVFPAVYDEGSLAALLPSYPGRGHAPQGSPAYVPVQYPLHPIRHRVVPSSPLLPIIGIVRVFRRSRLEHPHHPVIEATRSLAIVSPHHQWIVEALYHHLLRGGIRGEEEPSALSHYVGLVRLVVEADRWYGASVHGGNHHLGKVFVVGISRSSELPVHHLQEGLLAYPVPLQRHFGQVADEELVVIPLRVRDPIGPTGYEGDVRGPYRGVYGLYRFGGRFVL